MAYLPCVVEFFDGYRAENGCDKLLPEPSGFPQVDGKAGGQNLEGRALNCGEVTGSIEGEESSL